MLEPAPETLVAFSTSKGAIEVQLWTKEFSAARNFEEKCSANALDGLTFHKVVEGTLIEAKTGTIDYSLPHESHPRISFSQRGYVGLIKDEKTNKSSTDGFFISLQPLANFHKTHQVVGKVTTESFYTVLKIIEGERNQEKLVYPVKASVASIDGDSTKVQKRETETATKFKVKRPKKKVTLNYDQEVDTDVINVKMKLAHELLYKSETAEENERTTNSPPKDEYKNEVIDNEPTRLPEVVSPSSNHIGKGASVSNDTQTNTQSVDLPRRRSYDYDSAVDFNPSDEEPLDLKNHVYI